MTTQEIFKKKPANLYEMDRSYQLFSFDVTKEGAKNFLFDTYDNIYKIIKENKNTHFYEDNTFVTGIKLFIDYDETIIFNTQLQRDKYSKHIIDFITLQINNKIKELFNIINSPIIILISDTLLKMSLHIIYPNIIFNNIYEMKYFMHDIDKIDKNVYKIGCFRMMYCSKMGKDNKLIYHDSINYIKPANDYILFCDSCILYTIGKEHIQINIPQIKIIIRNKIIKNSINNNIIERNYVYTNINLTIIKTALDKISKLIKNNTESSESNYSSWLTIAFCIKDLYLGATKEQQIKIYKLFNTFSKKINNYNKEENKIIFDKLNPKIDINVLFNLSDNEEYILPFYNYKEIIFTPNNHKNIIGRDEKYININVNELLKYKYIFIKSPTGTGKTTLLKKIIDESKINNIISITSRVNLGSEHITHLDLEFYLDIKYNEFNGCNRLVIQLESLRKCNYKLFKNGIVILDEINSLLSHLRSPTLFNKRKEIYEYLIELIENANYVIGLDADLSDWNIKFLQEIREDKYIVYHNINKNKTGIEAIFYKSPQMVIDIMVNNIKENKYFMACFDSLKKMNKIIEYLSLFGNKSEWLIYSSEINYTLINTNKWKNKFVFFTPSILYGISHDCDYVDVFAFVYKNHLNSLQIYQMISRARKQNKVYIYCNDKQKRIKYKTINNIIEETKLYEKNLETMVPLCDNYMNINERPYRTMYYNHQYIDGILKTNIIGYLEDILLTNGYTVNKNSTIIKSLIGKLDKIQMVKENIVRLLGLDENNLSEVEKEIVSSTNGLEKHFNLKLFLDHKIDDKIMKSIEENLFIETLKSKYSKIKICKELMKVLNINGLIGLTKDISNKFGTNINNTWINDNINIIIKTFDIRTNKYNDFKYYNLYLLLITILKNLFDTNLFICNKKYIKGIYYNLYNINEYILKEHIKIMSNKLYDSNLFK